MVPRRSRRLHDCSALVANHVVFQAVAALALSGITMHLATALHTDLEPFNSLTRIHLVGFTYDPAHMRNLTMSPAGAF